jgi:ribosome-associated protein
MIEINEELQIPADEIRATVSTSSGPGGQNVNRVRTRVTLGFDVRRSASLSEDQRARILERLGSRIDNRGWLRVRSQSHRTQGRNREEALGRLVALLADALHEEPERRKTRKPRAAEERRLEGKRRRSRVKEARGRPGDLSDRAVRSARMRRTGFGSDPGPVRGRDHGVEGP